MVDNVYKNLIWLGHSSFRLAAAGKNIYFDPFQLSGVLPPADLIVVSHDHYDHCSPEDIAKIRKETTVIVTEPQSAQKLSGEIISLAPGESCEAAGFQIETVASYNTNKNFHPKGNSWLGFVVTVEGVRVYHAGDSDYIPEMKEVKADIALLPVSGTYVMTPEEAAQAARDINPAIAVPMHFGSIVGSSADAERFAALLEGKIRVEVP